MKSLNRLTQFLVVLLCGTKSKALCLGALGVCFGRLLWAFFEPADPRSSTMPPLELLHWLLMEGHIS